MLISPKKSIILLHYCNETYRGLSFPDDFFNYHVPDTGKCAKNIVEKVTSHYPRIFDDHKKDIIYIAALLHDLGRTLDPCQFLHSARGADKIEQYDEPEELKITDSLYDRNMIAAMIRPHGFDLERLHIFKRWKRLNDHRYKILCEYVEFLDPYVMALDEYTLNINTLEQMIIFRADLSNEQGKLIKNLDEKIYRQFEKYGKRKEQREEQLRTFDGTEEEKNILKRKLIEDNIEIESMKIGFPRARTIWAELDYLMSGKIAEDQIYKIYNFL